MAFTPATLRRLDGGGGTGISVWVYKTADTLATVDTSAYFSTEAAGVETAAGKLKVGDFVLAYTTTGPAAGIAFVQANTRDLTATPPVSGVVDLTNFTAIGTIDSD